MLRQVNIFLIVYSCVNIISPKILLECNFDKFELNPCFNSDVMVVSTLGDTVDSNPPNGPLSDVTSIITPTENGELCKQPYRINPYSWDMYFCNEDYCETATKPNSKCASGRFGHVQLFTTDVYSVPLKTGIGGINEQCIIYYYYIPNSVDIQMSITLRKVENDSTTEIIDRVTNSSLNGWSQRKIDFQARQSGYMIYFDFQKTIGVLPSFGIDEISMHQGRCSDAYITQSTTNEVSTSTVYIPTTESETSMVITMESSTITTTDKSTIISEETITWVISSTQMGTDQFTSSTSTTITTQTTSTMLATTAMSSSISTVKNSSTTTMETITSTNKTTENIELTSITNLSHLTSTVTDQQPTSNSQTLTIILATTIPIGISGVIFLIIWLKDSFCSKRIKSNIHEMNRVAPSPI
ncbi:unnamed protein product [Rotaria magnacalcarata]